MMELLHTLKEALFTPEGLQNTISQFGYPVLIAIVFAETGLLIGFCLPGDSLLFIAGFLAHPETGRLNIWILNLVLMAAAIIGDTVGYWIGNRAGAALYRREDSLIFRRKHLLAAKAFYDKHGGKAIILARFVPIVRTFAPMVAGAAEMKYRDFVIYNVVGGIAWVFSMTMAGYLLGSIPFVKANLEKMVLLIIAISVMPIFIEYFRHQRAAKNNPPTVSPGE